MSSGKTPHLFRREGTGLEFDRVAFFSADLYQVQMPPDVANWATLGSFTPVVWFVLSVPVAFLISPLAGILTWLLSVPCGIVLNRYAPTDAARFFE